MTTLTIPPRFGEQRLSRPDIGRAHRALYRVMGVGEPAHYLHHLYLKRALAVVPRLNPDTILDAGCGSGDHAIYLARRYPKALVTTLDVDRDLIARNRATEHVADDLTPEQFQEACRGAGFTVLRTWRTFGRWTGELATSLFALPYRNTPRNRVAQGLLAPACRALVLLDPVVRGRFRYAVGLLLTSAVR
jgi:SAM-dependent methyltransferase